jgi:hypothetical protein
MPIHQEAPAVAIARAHIEAWSNHDFETARRSLAAGVHITATTTAPIMAPVDAAFAHGDDHRCLHAGDS